MASRWEHAGGDGVISGIGEVAVVGASRGTGLQCVLYLARKKMACRAIARDPAVHSQKYTRWWTLYNVNVLWALTFQNFRSASAPCARSCQRGCTSTVLNLSD